ncbi:glycoside hydrolase family 3 N-terminal domain-containing protein [Chryseoglobus sp. 28M-23]|uniref:glycoside hydrolase family 3 N-terminal domain-containing protein n=1 Tax=Chryseoglobus sp. 28M-23 TaxID=2772253 RepID=UPI0017475F71|nr:glycoside hydrolase family 3 N-terminal domain-containing protein [Chryseoglobus sp. 28M-23]QOD92920.1 glycoside hydrolase family 3 protein [Chryseoglobus sp. 28M-23]
MRRRSSRPRALLAAAAALAVLAVAGCVSYEAAPRAPEARAAGAPPLLDPTVLYVDQRLADMTLRQKLAAQVMIHVPGTDASRIRSVVERHGFGGVILMGDNVGGSATTVSRLTAALHAEPGLPILTAIDQEGGIVRRLLADDAPAGRALWTAPPSATEAAFRERAGLVDQAGVLINFGVVADVSPDGSSFIGPRTLGESPTASAERVAAAVRGESGAALSTLKHFPGHGASPDDSHVSVPRSSISLEEWRRTHAVPFIAGIEAGAPLVMTGHLQFDSISAVPATLSSEWITILRDELGFDGIVVTDDMLMLQRSGLAEYADPERNAVRALAAGNDLLLYVLPGDPRSVGIDPESLLDALVASVEDGTVSQASVDDSVRRLISTRRAASGESGPYRDCGPKCWGQSPRGQE